MRANFGAERANFGPDSADLRLKIADSRFESLSELICGLRGLRELILDLRGSISGLRELVEAGDGEIEAQEPDFGPELRD